VAKSASRKPDSTTRKAEARFHELLDELKLLTVAFPHLREAVDPEDLPVSFLLKRGADRATLRAERSQPAAAKMPAVRRKRR
jgi:hypothetical protein